MSMEATDQEGRNPRTDPARAALAQPSSPVIRKAATAGEGALRALQSISEPCPCTAVGIKESLVRKGLVEAEYSGWVWESW